MLKLVGTFENQPHAAAADLEARAFAANAPHGYEPQISKCPSNAPTIRSASSLSDEETSWLQTRRPATVQPMRDLLGRLKIAGLDTDAYIDKHQSNVRALPNIGIAISGGGYRAMLNGAGVLEAFDSRTPKSTSTGQLGGVLQSATYLSGRCTSKSQNQTGSRCFRDDWVDSRQLLTIVLSHS